jgi:hypothetical protein
MPEKMKALYRGDGSQFHAGIPARHLTQDEFEALDTEQRAALRASALYEVRTDKEMEPAVKDSTAAPEPRKDGE